MRELKMRVCPQNLNLRNWYLDFSIFSNTEIEVHVHPQNHIFFLRKLRYQQQTLIQYSTFGTSISTFVPRFPQTLFLRHTYTSRKKLLKKKLAQAGSGFAFSSSGQLGPRLDSRTSISNAPKSSKKRLGRARARDRSAPKKYVRYV